MSLQLWRCKQGDVVVLDKTPTGEEEERNLFDTPVDRPTDLNAMILHERWQDMNERIIFADRAFFLTYIWIIFLVALPFIQMIFSIWGHGLDKEQFIAVVTTTTASVFGFWYLVGRYLFPEKNGKTDKTDKN